MAIRADQAARLLGAAAVLGVAFDVKLLQSLVALPGMAVFAYLGLHGTPARRLRRLAVAGAVYVVVALAWLTATQLAPAHDRPWAIGSTNGSAWNAAFVFNGTDRLGGKSPEPQFTVYQPGHHYPTATQSERDHIPIVPPSPTRLLARIGPLSGERLPQDRQPAQTGNNLAQQFEPDVPRPLVGQRRVGDLLDQVSEDWSAL